MCLLSYLCEEWLDHSSYLLELPPSGASDSFSRHGERFAPVHLFSGASPFWPVSLLLQTSVQGQGTILWVTFVRVADHLGFISPRLPLMGVLCLQLQVSTHMQDLRGSSPKKGQRV